MSKWKQYFKKIVAVASMAAMLITATDWSKVSAATQEKDLLITDSFSFSEEAEADNDELFAGYVQKAFLGDSGISLFSSTNHTMNLNEDEKIIYEALKSAVKEIADGTQASTVITLSDWSKSFSYTELGLEASADANAAKAAVEKAFENSINMGNVMHSLLADCPYELYWYDKTEGMSSGYSISTDGSTCTLSSLRFKMTVASAYASGTEYTTDTSKTGATKTAVTNARAIVTENEGKSDYDKLVAYRNKICEMVSYDKDAAENDSTPYGDPWQLIYVFDNNSNTNVVCEGYSKAFQYLCELSKFTGNVTCYTVSGGIPGGHMWNHVTIGGKNYLVDVTNCDEGTIGAPDQLFLKGMTGDISLGYTKTILSKTITYKFDDETEKMFGTKVDSILNLSADDYVETVDDVQSVSASSSVSNLTWRYATGATLTATPTLATGVTKVPTYQWYKVSDDNTETAISDATNATYTMETGLPAGNYTYRVYASIGECKKSVDVRITVNPLVLTKGDLEFTSDTITKVYDGTTASTATVQIKAGVVDTNAVSISGTAKYNSPNVSEANTVTFTPTAITNGNYTLAATETIEHAATITKKTGTAAPAAPTATTANIKDTEITLTEVTGCEYSKDGTNWQDSPKFTGLTPNTSYTFYQRIKASDNVEASANSSASIKTLPTSLNDAELTLNLPEEGYTYDGTEKKPSVTVTLNGVTVDASQYTVKYTKNKDAGTEAKVTVTAIPDGQYSGTAEKNFSIKKLVLVPSIAGSTSKTYDGKITCDGTGLSIELADAITGEDVSATATYAYDSVTAGTNKTITASNITLSGTDSKNYVLSSTTTQAVVGTIEKATATIDVNPTEYSKVYKDADFALSGISYTGDGTLTYTVTDSKYLSTDGSGNPTGEAVDNDKVITVSADGKVTIVGSGSAQIKITATAGTNYNAVGNTAAKSIIVTVAKAASPLYKPGATLNANIDCITVSDVILSGDWKWTDETASIRFDSVAEGSPVAATAVYQGADAKHYETTSVNVAITRANHNHVAGQEVLFTGEGEKAPTCTKAGTGHKECTVDGCGEIVESNISVDPLGHKLSDVAKKDATCTEKGVKAHWECSRCGKVFADKDGNTETTLDALKISEKGHQWKTEYTIDKAATETEMGSKSIHCAICDTIKPGSSVDIPKIIVATPTPVPTATPTVEPTAAPTMEPTATPTVEPTATPTVEPTATPTVEPTAAPTVAPTATPTKEPEASANPEATKVPEVSEPTKSPEISETPQPTKVPNVGNKIKNQKNVYVVTKVTTTEKTVVYRQPQNKNITSVNISKTVKIKGVSYKVTSISTNAFKDCKKLKRVTIGSNIVSIGKNAFKNCKKLKEIFIQSSKLKLKNVGKDAFKGLNRKVVITVPAKQYKSYKKLLRKRGIPVSVKIKKK